MRKIVTLSAVAALAFSAAACGKSEPANSDANAMVTTEMNANEAIEGTTNDSMTNVDAAAGASDNMTAGNGAMNATDGNAMGATNAMAADNAAAK